MENVENINDQVCLAAPEDSPLNSKCLDLAKDAMDQEGFEAVVDLLCKELSQSPLREISNNHDFFSILEDLFFASPEYFEKMISPIENHQMKMKWEKPFFFSINYCDSILITRYKWAAKLDSYDFNTAADIISKYDDARMKIDAYLTLALKFEDTHFTTALALAKKELAIFLEVDALRYIEYGINISQMYLVFGHQKELMLMLSDLDNVIFGLAEDYGNLPGIAQEKTRLSDFKQEIYAFQKKPKDIQLNCASSSYVILSTTNPLIGRDVIFCRPDKPLFDNVTGFVKEEEDNFFLSSFWKIWC